MYLRRFCRVQIKVRLKWPLTKISEKAGTGIQTAESTLVSVLFSAFPQLINFSSSGWHWTYLVWHPRWNFGLDRWLFERPSKPQWQTLSRTIFLTQCFKYHVYFSRAAIVVQRSSTRLWSKTLEVMGSNPAGCWAFFLLFSILSVVRP